MDRCAVRDRAGAGIDDLRLRPGARDGAVVERRALAAIGAVFFAIGARQSARPALFAASALFALSIIACAAFLTWMRRVTG
jgi:hypothetical protein